MYIYVVAMLLNEATFLYPTERTVQMIDKVRIVVIQYDTVRRGHLGIYVTYKSSGP